MHGEPLPEGCTISKAMLSQGFVPFYHYLYKKGLNDFMNLVGPPTAFV